LDIFPSHEEEIAYRIEFFGDKIDNIAEFNPYSGKTIKKRPKVAIYPNTHYVTANVSMEDIIENINKDLELRIYELEKITDY